MKNGKAWWIVLFISLAVILPFAAPYFTFDPSAARVALSSSSLQFPILVAHIITALIALLVGFVQFRETVRRSRPMLHRYAGRLYVACVGISGILAIALVFYMESFTKAVGFLTLSAVWLYATWRGYRMARSGSFDAHRRWMIRSFGITLVAVSGRIAVPFLLLLYAVIHGFSLPGGREEMVGQALNVNIWVGLVLNLIAVEWIVLKPPAASSEA
ncbi:DUF2306 domain-containing protein [Cohnella hashimotonis]|uniref:DUF2306 domain-containing protein n=1 Tax=Cohnella hashimotonis TaxID=2826895 RepID=A0ABT6TEJ5_9BACL|nr:DUF2306 domain-containing protein [Cohnella hashimotonis]MDI4645242.1 DUF2306 domain-containing protein [Cohnella hashimotonis]